MSFQRPKSQLQVAALEDRTVPTALVGLSSGNQLVRFDSDAPTMIQSTTPVTGLLGDNLVGIDVRPSTGVLYGLGSSSRLYVIDPTTGLATQAGGLLATPFTPNLSGSQFGFNFNPAADKIRVVSNTTQNLRLDPTTGQTVATDTPLAYNTDSFNANVGGTAPTPSIGAAAYTNNTPNAGSTTPVTTLYDIDTVRGLLVTQGQAEGVQQLDPNTGNPLTGNPSPNGGQLYVVGGLPGFATAAPTGFDIEAGTDRAFATRALGTTTQLYQVNLATAGTMLLGTLPNANLIAVAVAPPAAAGVSTLQLASTTDAFGVNRAPLIINVTRTGSTAGVATVNYSTANGTAIAGVDYLATSGTLTFGPTQTTQQIILQVPGGTANPSPAKSFTLTLAAPTGGATLGANVTTTVTIPQVNPTPADRVHFFATGVGVGGGPQINVYNALGGALAYSFFAFEPTFTGGVTVATGDINGDGVDDIVVGTGVGGGPRVTVFDGASQGKVVLADFFAYESTFRGGVNVAVGDVNGDGFADVIAGAGVGGGPRIEVFDGGALTPGASPTPIQNYFAYEDTFRGGVFVSAGNFNNDQFDDIIAGTGVGGGPRVQVFSGVPGTNGAAPAVLANFFAYDSGFRGGVTVGSGDVNGDGRSDIITGTGPGGGPNVSAYSTNGTQLANFFAFDPAFRGGVRVAGVDLSGLGTSTILAASGPGSPATVGFFDINGKAQGSFQPYAASFTGGVFIG